MGKALIIPGADFSQNAIERITKEWYTPEANFVDLGISYDPNNYLVSISYYFMSSWPALLTGKTINCLKVRKNPAVTNPGYLVIGLFTNGASSPDSEISILIDKDGYDEYTFQEITIPSGKFIAIRTSGDTGINYSRAAMIYTTDILPSGLDFGHSILVPDSEQDHTAFEIQFGHTTS